MFSTANISTQSIYQKCGLKLKNYNNHSFSFSLLVLWFRNHASQFCRDAPLLQ